MENLRDCLRSRGDKHQLFERQRVLMRPEASNTSS